MVDNKRKDQTNDASRITSPASITHFSSRLFWVKNWKRKIYLTPIRWFPPTGQAGFTPVPSAGATGQAGLTGLFCCSASFRLPATCPQCFATRGGRVASSGEADGDEANRKQSACGWNKLKAQRREKAWGRRSDLPATLSLARRAGIRGRRAV